MPNPIMGAEDFSYVLQQVPGTMMFLGGTPPDRDPATAPANHSNRVMFDEDGDDRRHRALRRRWRCATLLVATGRQLTVGASSVSRHG